MKIKLFFCLFFLISSNLACFAVLNSDDAISEKYMRNHGYSPEALKLIDLQQARINGTETKYKETETWCNTKSPKWIPEKQMNFVRKTFMYLDTGLDDGKFMQHDIKYTNSWNDW